MYSQDPVTGECTTPRRVSRALLVVSAISLLVFWPLAAVVLFRGNALGFAIALFCSGLQGPFLAGYAFARAARKQWWRWLVLATGGLGILMFSLVDAVNLDLDGFFELLILGTAGAAIGHTMVTTIVGPLIFGRILCGWGCWRAMVLERLPVGKGSGRRKGVWVWTPLVGVAVSFAAAALFALVLDFKPGGVPDTCAATACGPSLPALPFTMRQLLRWHWLCTTNARSANTFVPPDSFCVGRAARRFSMSPPGPRRATNARRARKSVRWTFPWLRV